MSKHCHAHQQLALVLAETKSRGRRCLDIVMLRDELLYDSIGSCLCDLVLARVNYFAGRAVQIAPGTPSLIYSVTPAELGSRRCGQTRCASCRSERGRSVPRGIRRQYARGRTSVRLPQFGRGAGLDARNGRTRQRVVLFEMRKSCWTWEKRTQQVRWSSNGQTAALCDAVDTNFAGHGSYPQPSITLRQPDLREMTSIARRILNE